MVVQVSNSLISLLDANLTFIATVELIGLTSESPYLKEKVFYPSADLMRKGESFSQSLKDQLVFPKSFHGMVVIGEETGTLTSMLKHIVTLHEIELELKIDQALKIIEPAILLVTGAMVLFVMLCTFLPLYSVLSGVLGTK
jgi:type II secretory pathway component PulF